MLVPFEAERTIDARENGIQRVTTRITPRTPKRYRFDDSKIVNTITMIRAFNAIASRFNFNEQEIEELGIKDLVIEQTSNGIRF